MNAAIILHIILHVTPKIPVEGSRTDMSSIYMWELGAINMANKWQCSN